MSLDRRYIKKIGDYKHHYDIDRLTYPFNMNSAAKSTSERHDTSNFQPVWWYFLLSPAFVIYGYIMRQWFDLFWAYIFVAYGVIPMLDQVLPEDWKNPTIKQIVELENDQRYRLVLYIIVSLDFFIFFSEMGTIKSFTVFNVLPRLFVMANVYTTGMLVSHELMHKENKLDRALATIILIKNCYLHFALEHTQGHHKNVATPLDPASAPKGMTLYEFVPRSIKGGFLSAYRMDPRFVTLCCVASLAFLLVIYKIFGWRVLLVHMFAALGSIMLLELTNYIEHYGLQRKQLPDGTYERVTIRHSWNAAHCISNYFMIKLQRHSDHHENSLKPYQTLCTYNDSPQLPHGYLVCFLIAQSPKVSQYLI